LSALPLAEEEICSLEVLEDEEPDEEYFHEATGNEGASFERTYSRAALVLWPKARKLVVLAQAGLAVSLPYLKALAEQWLLYGEDVGSARWQEAHALAGHMLQGWPMQPRYSMEDEIRMLNVLTQLRDTAGITAFLAEVPGRGRYDGSLNAALMKAVLLLAPPIAVAAIEKLVIHNTSVDLDGCANLLQRVCKAMPEAVGGLGRAATALTMALIEKHVPLSENTRPHWQQTPSVEVATVVDLLTVLSQLDEADQGGRLVSHALSSPAAFPLDNVLLPAALQLTEHPPTRDFPPVQRLRDACLQHLRARIALPLAPPADFTRDSTLACQCQYCVQLSRFLASPERRVWDFQAAEQHRSHVERSIRQADCDVNCITQKHSRPYSLVCTKNQSSYERRVTQRQQDIEEYQRLGGILPS